MKLAGQGLYTVSEDDHKQLQIVLQARRYVRSLQSFDETIPDSKPSFDPNRRICGAEGARGTCHRKWGTCPYHPPPGAVDLAGARAGL